MTKVFKVSEKTSSPAIIEEEVINENENNNETTSVNEKVSLYSSFLNSKNSNVFYTDAAPEVSEAYSIRMIDENNKLVKVYKFTNSNKLNEFVIRNKDVIKENRLTAKVYKGSELVNEFSGDNIIERMSYSSDGKPIALKPVEAERPVTRPAGRFGAQTHVVKPVTPAAPKNSNSHRDVDAPASGPTPSVSASAGPSTPTTTQAPSVTPPAPSVQAAAPALVAAPAPKPDVKPASVTVKPARPASSLTAKPAVAAKPMAKVDTNPVDAQGNPTAGRVLSPNVMQQQNKAGAAAAARIFRPK